jgi:hypothetical protein
VIPDFNFGSKLETAYGGRLGEDGKLAFSSAGRRGKLEIEAIYGCLIKDALD